MAALPSLRPPPPKFSRRQRCLVEIKIRARVKVSSLTLTATLERPRRSSLSLVCFVSYELQKKDDTITMVCIARILDGGGGGGGGGGAFDYGSPLFSPFPPPLWSGGASKDTRLLLHD